MKLSFTDSDKHKEDYNANFNAYYALASKMEERGRIIAESQICEMILQNRTKSEH